MAKLHLPYRSRFCCSCCGNGCRSRPRLLFRLILVFFVVSTIALYILNNWHTVTYLLRPLWDTPPRPFVYIPHYYSPNLTMEELCSLHGWSPRSHPRRVFDAVIFNNELDLLEIRWRELYPSVTRFLLLESNGTFTGIPKPLWFDAARREGRRFQFAEEKLSYMAIRTPSLQPGQHPYSIEAHQRRQMELLFNQSELERGDLIVMSDTDEIPSAHTIELLRHCDGYPSVIHLQLRNYIYSFEFPIDKDRSDMGSWRSTARLFEPGVTEYEHTRRTDHILADCGWHCSFCFPTIEEVVFKMRAYSHADRVTHPSFLEKERIQERLCSGKDLFDMLPEEYSYRDLIGKMGSVPSSYSAVNLPSHLLRNAHRFKYLLPGNCKRPS